MAILEIGITAALSAAAANWLILRRAQKRYRESAQAVTEPPPDPGPLLPPGQHDEADDASGHRIYLNPWAADHGDDLDDDEEIPLGVIEEYADEYPDEYPGGR